MDLMNSQTKQYCLDRCDFKAKIDNESSSDEDDTSNNEPYFLLTLQDVINKMDRELEKMEAVLKVKLSVYS
jgi:hypothetical protein